MINLELSGLKNFIRSRQKELKIPGIGLGITKDGKTIFSGGFGFADLEKKEKVIGNTIFRMGSISKTFTAIGLFQLIEQGKVQLDQPINDLLPDGKLISKKQRKIPITLKHLLTHTSGIGELLARRDLFKLPRFIAQDPEKLYPLEKLFNRTIKLRHSPGEKWAYANFGFNLIGYLVEILSGQPFAEYMRKHLLEPLGMSHSDFERSETIRNYQAKGYKLKHSKNVEFGTNLRVHKPAGALYASVNDMLKYMNCLLNQGKYKGGQLIQSESLKTLWTPHYRVDERLPAMGYAFWLYDIEDYKVVGHGGSINGYLAQMYLLPREKLGIIVAVNQMSLGNMEAIRIAHEILHKVLELKEPMKIKEKNYTILKRVNQGLIQEMTGRYGPSKGILTNTRFYMAGGEIKIGFKHGELMYKTMWGGKKKGAKLWLVDKDDPFYYKILDNLSYSCVEPHESVIFNQNDQGEITSISKGFHTYIKKPWYKSFKFKLYSRIGLLLFGIVISLFFLSLFSV